MKNSRFPYGSIVPSKAGTSHLPPGSGNHGIAPRYHSHTIITDDTERKFCESCGMLRHRSDTRHRYLALPLSAAAVSLQRNACKQRHECSLTFRSSLRECYWEPGMCGNATPKPTARPRKAAD